MLVVTRRVGETIAIDGDILVSVISIQGKQVRLGVTAPTSIRVMRTELVERHRHRGCKSKTGGAIENLPR